MVRLEGGAHAFVIQPQPGEADALAVSGAARAIAKKKAALRKLLRHSGCCNSETLDGGDLVRLGTGGLEPPKQMRDALSCPRAGDIHVFPEG